MDTSELAVLLRFMDQAFDKKAWHGPNLRGCFRRVTPEAAAWRPAPDRHSIAEIVLHAAYWKYVVRRKLHGLKRGSFPIKGSNWFPVPARLSTEQWAGMIRLLEEEHRRLREAVAAFPLESLHRNPHGSKLTHAVLIEGIACHDVYHAGQIQVLRALWKSEVDA